VGTHSLIAVGAEEARVVAFLHNNVCDARLVLLLQGDTGLTNSQQLIIQHLRRREGKMFIKTTPGTRYLFIIYSMTVQSIFHPHIDYINVSLCLVIILLCKQS